MSGITLGIEEELMIVDPRSRDVVADPDEGIMAKASEHRMVNEFLRSQIDTNSRVCGSVGEIARSLLEIVSFASHVGIFILSPCGSSRNGRCALIGNRSPGRNNL